MAVAKSFQNYIFLGEPFEKSGRMYVEVQNPKTLTVRTVRWYPEAENEDRIIMRSMRTALGFENGFITIFKGDTYPHLEYFQLSCARYCTRWGWYIISTDEVPNDLPEGITPIRLDWNLVGEGENLKSEEVIKTAVESLLYDEGASDFVGSVGERLELTVVIKRAIRLENDYGVSTMHIMETADGNVFVWTTASKTWAEGETKTIRGTLKEHKVYRNVKQNILTRCMERK